MLRVPLASTSGAAWAAAYLPEAPVLDEIPKQELLIKLLSMTESTSDNEALMAVRKANQLLRSAGWTWEALVRAKIKVIEDPFKNVFDPSTSQQERRKPAAPPPPPPPRSPPQQPRGWNPAPPPPPPPPPPPRRPISLSTKKNLYRNSCYCCGIMVEADQGFIIQPSQHNPRAPSKWEVVCSTCNTGSFVGPTKAKRTLGASTTIPGLGDL